MKRASTRSAILAAERKLAQSRRDSVESFRGFRSALRSRLAQPSSIALGVGLAALTGFWLARRNKPRTARAGNGTSLAGLATAFLIRFGWQRISGLLKAFRASRQEHSAIGDPVADEHLKSQAGQP